MAASFIVDQDPIFAFTGWHLAHSLVMRGGLGWSDIHVQFTPEVDEQIVGLFRRAGCVTHRLTRFGDGKYCNKLAQWENLRDVEAEHIVFMDTDMICIAPFAEFLPAEAVAGKIVDLANPSLVLLDAVFAQAGVGDRPPLVRVEAEEAQTYRANCNGGFYSVPKRFAEPLFDAWRGYAQGLLADADLLRAAGKESHVDQISFCMAIQATGLPFDHLPSNVNYYLHFAGEHSLREPARPLAVLHYHNDAVNFAGLLAPDGATEDEERAAVHEANKLIAANFNTPLFLAMRQARFPERSAPAA